MKIKYILFVFSLMAILSCTKNDECPEGYVCVEDTCICPEENFEIPGHQMCRSLGDGEFFGVYDCIFQDTFFVSFLDKDLSVPLINATVFSSFEGVTRPTSHNLIEFSEFDSLVSIFDVRPIDQIVQAGSFLGTPRFFENYTVGANLKGRLTADRFEGDIEWRIVNSFQGDRIGEIVESCPITLER